MAYRSVSYGCNHGSGCIQQSFLHYDWDAITTVVTFTETNLTQLCQLAHLHNVKVVVAKGKFLNTSLLANSTYTRGWRGNITSQMAALRPHGIYGLNLDIEHFGHAPVTTPQLLVQLVCDLRDDLQGIGLHLHSIDTQIWGETTDFDLVSLAKCVEFLMPMGYDLIAKQGASSNAPLPALASGLMQWYLDAGVPPKQIILGLPWYGYAFPCLNDTETKGVDDVGIDLENNIKNNAVPVCRVPASKDRALWQMGLGTILQKIASNESRYHQSDPSSGSVVLEYTETRHPPLGRRQVWYEDASSLATKVRALVQAHNLAGTAVWSAEAIWNAPRTSVASIWKSVSPPRHPSPQAVALMSIFNATGGPGWHNRYGWGVGDPCAIKGGWYGVCCKDNATEVGGCQGLPQSVVTGLLLRGNGLRGRLPDTQGVWSSLPHIQTLSLRSNSLSGPIPAAISHLSDSLINLNLRRNILSGTIPHQLGQLRHLVHFSVFMNRISGSIPPELGNLTLIGSTAEGGFDLTCNNMSGVIPSSLSSLHNFHDNIGLGGVGSERCRSGCSGLCNRWRCPVPPIRFQNGSVTRAYATCMQQ